MAYNDDYERYRDTSRYKAEQTVGKSNRAAIVLAAVVAVLLAAAAIWFFVIPKPFDVSINGKKFSAMPGTTIAKAIEDGAAQPTPGNLLAIDGSVITEGGGNAFAASVNGADVPGDTVLEKDMAVIIGDGTDTTESFTEREEEIPFGTDEGNLGFDGYWAGSIHLLSDGQPGIRVVKTGDISGKEIVLDKQPAINGGYHIYTAKPADKAIALTFDDGPWPETTSQILDILEQNEAKATFFTIGEQIANFPDEIKRADAMGCEICTHTWDHASGSGGGVDITKMSASEQVEEVTKGYDAIKAILGADPEHYLRAPGGNFHDAAITNLWPYVDAEFGWDVDTEDWSKPGADAIYERIMSVQPGQIVLMHDGGGDRSQTVEALRRALPELKARGYKFVTVDEMLGYGMPAGE